MTSHQQLEQLIHDRRAVLARTAPQRRRAQRWPAGWTLRPRAGQTSGTTETAQLVGSFVPSVAATAGADLATSEWATTLAHLVADHGLRRQEAAIARLVRTARHHHALRLCADILEDRSLPDVVRERALGRLLRGLARSTEASATSSNRAA